MYEISEAITEAEVRSTIRDLPRSLTETYLRILEKACHHGGPARIDLIRNIFRWIACAQRPLRMGELEEAVGLEKTDTYLHAERTPTNSGARLIRACHNLVVYNSSDDTVTFAHHTVQQFLFSPLPRTSELVSKLIHIDPDQFNKELGEICIAYLSFSDFETQLVNLPKSAVLDRDGVEQMIWGEVPLATRIRSVISWGRSPKMATVEKASQYITLSLPTKNNRAEALLKKYLLLEYVVSYWPFHAAGFNESTPCWPAFKALALHRQLMFDFRPWLEEQHQLKVSAVAERLNTPKSRLWQSQSPTLTLEERQSLSIYTWALGHEVRSLLILANQPSMERYFKEIYSHEIYGNDIYGQINNLRSGSGVKFMDAIASMDMTHQARLWNDGFILLFLERYLGRLPDNHTVPEAKYALRILLAEMEAWANLSPSSLSHIFDKEVAQSVKAGNEDYSTALMKFHCKTAEQLATSLLHLCATGPPSWTAIRRILDHRVSGSISEGLQFELMFALETALPAIYNAFQEYAWPSNDILWILKLLSVLSPDHHGIAETLIHFDQLDTFRRFRLPTLDWKSTTFGSERIHKKLVAIDGMDLLEIAFTQAHGFLESQPLADSWSYRTIVSSDRKRLLVSLLDLLVAHYRTGIHHYETRGVHLLNWALESHLFTSAKLLRRGYAELVKSTEYEILAVGVLENAMKGGFVHMESVIDLPWTPSVVREAMNRPAAQSLNPAQRDQLLALMKRP
jgi:hypothetical protein